MFPSHIYCKGHKYLVLNSIKILIFLACIVYVLHEVYIILYVYKLIFPILEYM